MRVRTYYGLALFACAASGTATAEWIVIADNDEYTAYADVDSVRRLGDSVQMSDLVDLKTPRLSPYGRQHASSLAHSEFDCSQVRVRTLSFSLHSDRMGSGELVEGRGESKTWLPAVDGSLLRRLWSYACEAK